MNAGAAANSIAALTGSFVGALAGVEAIDKQWLREVENSDLLIGVGENLAQLLSNPKWKNCTWLYCPFFFLFGGTV